MQLQCRRVGNTLVVRMAGDLDLHTAPTFRSRVDEQLSRFPRVDQLLLNLEQVAFVDSSGLGALLGRLRQLQQRGGRVIAVGMQPRIRRLFEMSGLLKLIQVAESERAALEKPAREQARTTAR